MSRIIRNSIFNLVEGGSPGGAWSPIALDSASAQFTINTISGDVSWTDTNEGNAQYEVWSETNGDAAVLVGTTSKAATEFTDTTCKQNASVVYKVRAKVGSNYSDFIICDAIVTPLCFKTDQSTLNLLRFSEIRVAAKKAVLINWGDGTTTEVTGTMLNIDKEYGEGNEGQYDVSLSGDLNSITRLHHAPNVKSYGDLTNWEISTISQMARFRVEESNFSGDISNWVVVPSCSYFYVFKNNFTGTLPVINGTVTALRYYCNLISIEGHNFTGFRTSMSHFYVDASRTCVSPEKIDSLLKSIADYYENNVPLVNCEFKLEGTNMGYPTGGNLNVDKVRIETYFTNAGVTATITVNTVKRFNNGKLIIGFDDSQGNLFTYGMPIFKDKGIAVTVYDNGSILGKQPNRLTRANKIEMYSDGMDFQCHSNASHTDLTTLNEVQLLANLQDVNDGFTDMGIPAPQHIAYPGGSYNDNVKLWCSSMRLTGSTSAGSPVVSELNYPEVDKFVIKRISIDNISQENLNLFKELMDYAKCSKAAIVCYGHGVLPNNDTYEIGEQELKEIIDYAEHIGIDIITHSQMYELLEA